MIVFILTTIIARLCVIYIMNHFITKIKINKCNKFDETSFSFR